MRRTIVSALLLFLLFAGTVVAYAQDDKLPALLKERRSGKVMFDKEQAMQEIKRQRLAQSDAIWKKWGEKACPVFSYKELNEKEWTNENIRGKVTLINFWHINCGPCIREIPWLNKLMEKYEDVNFLACTFNDATQAKGVVEKTGFLYSQLTNAMSLWHAFGVDISPVTIILDKEGKVVAVVTGINDSLKRVIESKLKEANK